MNNETKQNITISLSAEETLSVLEMLEEYLTCYEHTNTPSEILQDYENVTKKLVSIYNDYFENNK